MSPNSLFPAHDETPRTETFEVPDAELWLVHGLLPAEQASRAFEELHAQTRWERERIRIAGREVDVPRLVAWHGDSDAIYHYSGVRHDPEPWTALLGTLRDRVVEALAQPFNSVLLNYYRDGRESMGWHSDDEAALGPRPTIASISLGAERTFQLKHRTRKDVSRIALDLPHGSLLVMAGDCQRCWKHQLPKRVGKQAPGARINLTFRYVHPVLPGSSG